MKMNNQFNNNLIMVKSKPKLFAFVYKNITFKTKLQNRFYYLLLLYFFYYHQMIPALFFTKICMCRRVKIFEMLVKKIYFSSAEGENMVAILCM